MQLDDFDFDLPEHQIATRPVRPRRFARLLHAENGQIADRHVFDLPNILRPGDRLVLNDTRVIAARLLGQRWRHGAQGRVSAKIDVTLLSPRADGGWTALAKPMRKLAVGDQIVFTDDFTATVVGIAPDLVLRFNCSGDDFDAALDAAGAMPLPPYIAGKRPPDVRDRNDYQTIWAKHTGAVAAPTASLHFDQPLLDTLRHRGIGMTFVTLHVGAGTFLPVKVQDVTRHKMHAERGRVCAQAAAELNAARAAGGRIIPIGTTALRLIESAANPDGMVREFDGETDIFIYPGYKWRVADGLMTNFHLPKSTLMMLVAALMGHARIMAIYAHAVTQGYRFFSYGDASLLIPSRM